MSRAPAVAGSRRIIRVQDLADDPAVWADYDHAHSPGQTPQAVLDAQRRHNILDPAGLDAESAALPDLVDWHRRMGALQRRPCGSDHDWPEADLVFRQSDHP